MNYDFSSEQEQKNFVQGPIPEGSSVFVVIEPETTQYSDTNDPLITICQSGLRRMHLKCVVSRGRYKGITFWDDINLPKGMQNISLLTGQEIACNIGGAQLKALLQSAKRPLAIKSLKDFAGLECIVQVKISNKPSTSKKTGRQYYNNVLGKILIPGDEEYTICQQKGEIITDNPVPVPELLYYPSNTQDQSYEKRFEYQPGPQDTPVHESQNQSQEQIDKVPF